MGLALESIIGDGDDSSIDQTVDNDHLSALLAISNQRFKENEKRISRFQNLLAMEFDKESSASRGVKLNKDGVEWEDAAVRKQRKREEGLKMSRELRELQSASEASTTDDILNDSPSIDAEL